MTRNGELLVQTVAARLLSPEEPLIVYDVGANIGQWSCALIMTMERAGSFRYQLYSFEPSATAYSRLVVALKEADSAGAAHAVQVAMSNRSGVSQLYKPHEGAGSSSLHEDDRFEYPSETVSLATIDSFAQASAHRHIVLLKVDAEGHDLTVLEGARQMLKAGSIDLVQFEYNFRWIFGRHYLRDAFQLFADVGYSLGKVTPKGIEFYQSWDQELETFREANYLACRQHHAQLFPVVKWWKPEPS